MTMKKFLLMAIVMMVSTSTFAQRETGAITLQPRLSIVAADFNNTSDTEARVGLAAGAEAEYYVSPSFGLSAGLFYAQEGAKLKDLDVTWKLDYLNVPIMANFYVWKGLALKAGLQPGFKVSSSMSSSKSSVKIDEGVNTFDLSVPFGLSYDFGRVCVDARYTLGLTKTFKGKEFDSKNITFQLGVGYKFSLK